MSDSGRLYDLEEELENGLAPCVSKRLQEQVQALRPSSCPSLGRGAPSLSGEQIILLRLILAKRSMSVIISRGGGRLDVPFWLTARATSGTRRS